MEPKPGVLSRVPGRAILFVAVLATGLPRARAEDLRRGPARAQVVAPALPAPVLPETPEGYELAVQRGFQAFEEGQYVEARERFAEAHALYPNARTLRALGKVEYELSNYARSIAYLEQSLSALERPLTDEQRSDAQELLARVRTHMVSCTITTKPEGTRLTLDGAPLALPQDGSVALAVGDHVLEAAADGHRPQRRELHIEAGAAQELTIVMLPLEDMAEPDSAGPLYKKWWLWTAVGGALAASVVTGIVIAHQAPEASAANGGTTGAVLRIPQR